MMRAYLLAFFKELERLIPPPPMCHHALSWNQYGSDETSWDDKLAVSVNDHGIFATYFIDDVDLMMSPENLASAVVSLHLKRDRA